MNEGKTDHQLASDLAVEAGKLLLEVRAELVKQGAHPWMLKDSGDQYAHQYLMKMLNQERPDDAVLSEEGIQGDYSSQKRVWIVDPLDGTREFGEYPRDDWAVHVALVENGELIAGAVSIPAREQVFSTPNPEQPPARETTDKNALKVAISRTRPGRAVYALSEFFELELIPMGSAGVKAMAVVQGIADVYAHSGGQNEWDSAAPVAVARAAGLWTSHLDGSELIYNRPDPFVENLIVCRPEIADSCLKIFKQAGF